jgi:hypothetical protein
MAEPIEAATFHLSFDGEEDRLFIAVDVTPDQRYAMALPRRLAKLMLGALADMYVSRRGDALARNPLVRNTVLSFEHSQAVAEGLSSGETRFNREKRPLIAPARVIHKIMLTPKSDGGIAVALDDKHHVITIDMRPQRLHRFMAGVLNLATEAQWDLPRIATWLEHASAEASPSPRVLQ